MRWNHPGRGLIYPDEFLDLVEQSGMMRQLTQTALAQSLAQAAEWWRAGIELPVSVNVSVRDLSDRGFADVVAGLLRDHGLPAGALQAGDHRARPDGRPRPGCRTRWRRWAGSAST